MKQTWKAGDIIPPNGQHDCWTAGIDIKSHSCAIAIYAMTEQEAIERRNLILTACLDSTMKGEQLTEQQLLNLAAEHGFGRMVAKEKKRRTAPPPPDIFVGAWEHFVALARAIPTIYRDRLLRLRDGLQNALGIWNLSDDELVEAVARAKLGVTPATEPTVEQEAAFKLEFFQAQAQNCSHNDSIRRALTAAMKAGIK